MKHIKKYENYQERELKIGDIVYCRDIIGLEDVLKTDTKYQIIDIEIDEDGDKFCNVKDVERDQKMGRANYQYDAFPRLSIGGIQSFRSATKKCPSFFLDRFISELEYDAKKYNL